MMYSPVLILDKVTVPLERKVYVNMFFDYLAAIFVSILLIVADVLEGLSNVLRRLTDDKNSGQDYVDIRAGLSKVKDKLHNKIIDLENKRRKEIRVMCSDLSDATQKTNPALTELINNIQKYVKEELKGTMLQYGEKQISKREDYFRALLLWDDTAGNSAIKKEIKRITNDAELYFYRQLITHMIEEISHLKEGEHKAYEYRR